MNPLRICAPSVVMSLGLLAANAAAQPATAQPTTSAIAPSTAKAGGGAPSKDLGKLSTAIDKANTKINALLKKKSEPGTDAEKKAAAEITEAVREIMDIGELGKRALVDHWDKLSEANRSEYQTLLRTLLEDNYVKGMRANLAYEVSYVGESINKDKTVLVKTVVKTKRKGRPYSIKIDYTVIDGKPPKIVDVATDGVGLVENYRNQFNKIIAKDGIDALFAKMRKKLAK